jgi:hypothetical protein
MARTGKGVRTRQYNPRSDQRRNAGAKTLGAYVDAAVNHTRGAHDAGGKIIHDTPKAKRREFAREIAWRKSRNPERIDQDKLTHAAVKYEHPSKHRSESCAKCIHFIEGKPPRCEAVQSPILPVDWCKRFENASSAADEFYRKFHGRGPDKITTTIVAGIDPYGGHPELTSLGPLIRLVVGEDIELSDEGEVEDSDWDNELDFVPMAEYRRITERLDPHDKDEIREFKRWVQEVGAPDVAGVPPNGSQLYFVGGKKVLSDKDLIKLGCDPSKDICDLGDVYLIEYFAQKRFDRFEPTTYFHQFGEKTDVRPRLTYLRASDKFLLAGGEYVVKSVGIDN